MASRDKLSIFCSFKDEDLNTKLSGNKNAVQTCLNCQNLFTSQTKYECNLFLSEIDKQRLPEKHKVVEVNLKAKINSNCRKLSPKRFFRVFHFR